MFAHWRVYTPHARKIFHHQFLHLAHFEVRESVCIWSIRALKA